MVIDSEALPSDSEALSSDSEALPSDMIYSYDFFIHLSGILII
jgi:hypothetical protein